MHPSCTHTLSSTHAAPERNPADDEPRLALAVSEEEYRNSILFLKELRGAAHCRRPTLCPGSIKLLDKGVRYHDVQNMERRVTQSHPAPKKKIVTRKQMKQKNSNINHFFML